jgi:hypothetical protein
MSLVKSREKISLSLILYLVVLELNLNVTACPLTSTYHFLREQLLTAFRNVKTAWFTVCHRLRMRRAEHLSTGPSGQCSLIGRLFIRVHSVHASAFKVSAEHHPPPQSSMVMRFV